MRGIRITPGHGAALFLAAMTLSACLEAGESAPAGESRVAAQEAACLADGGRWDTAGASQLMICYRPTRDAGEACTRASDCQGYCLARSRTCAPVTPLYGCNDVFGVTGMPSTVCLE